MTSRDCGTSRAREFESLGPEGPVPRGTEGGGGEGLGRRREAVSKITAQGRIPQQTWKPLAGQQVQEGV
jgi:hypothetical protein